MANGIQSGQAPLQHSLRFSRPGPAKAPVQPRRRQNRRIFREVLKHLMVVTLVGSVPFAAWAWHQGHIQAVLDQAGDKIIEASVSAGFSLQRIRTGGHVRITDAQILEALGLKAGDPLFALDMDELKARVERLQWVGQAIISREIPDTIKVKIIERIPFARWQIQGEVMLVDETGTAILGAEMIEFEHLPLLVGPGAPKKAVSLFALLQSEKELAERVVSAIRIGERRWDLEFDSGVRLKLPEEGGVYGPAKAWATFAQLVREKNVLGKEVLSLDMRLDDRVILKLTPNGEKIFENNDLLI